jgi:deoxyadenosine/deoxycytidine kinase
MSLDIQIISIEGNIGSGKSTLLANLKKYFNNESNIIFLREPVDEWAKIKDENGTTMLEKFYADQEKYSFSFQMMAYISRLKLLRDIVTEIKNKQYGFIKKKTQEMFTNFEEEEDYITPPKYIIITERSLYTDKMVFAKMLFDTNKIEYINYQIYLNWFNTFAEEYPVHKIIYVRADPETCYKRISIRNRQGEDNIPLEYLKSCHKYHENMLDTSSSDCVCKNQLILNGNLDIYENQDILDDWIDSIQEFIF